jgi:CheY-like chemotaxis protein
LNPRILKSWSKRSAVVYTLASGNVGMMIRELLRNHGWRVAVSTDDFSELLDCVKTEQADIVIIDDDIDNPSSGVVRRAMSDPICCLLPTLAFISDQNRNERLALSRLGRPEIVAKPLTRWSAGIFLPIRKASELLILGREEAGIDLLRKLAKYEAAHSIVLPSLAIYLAKNDSPKAAEKLLISGLQGQSRDLSIVYALVDLYLNHAMPALAMRLLKTIHKSYVKADCITPDIIQTAFMMNNLSEGIELLKELRQKNPENRVITRYLCRALFAEGRIDEFKRIASRNHSIARYEEEWGPKKIADDELDDAG